MKKLLIGLLYSCFTFSLISSDDYPITIVIYNNVNEELIVSLEYQLNQHYIRNTKEETPFVPNNNQFHYLSTLAPQTNKNISVFAFTPCTNTFCDIHHNLQHYGFKKHYKMIQGSVTIQNINRSYDFNMAVFNGSVITINLNKYGITTHATEQFKSMQTFYDTGICIT